MDIPNRVIGRLSAYRRHLRRWLSEGREQVYSHDLATQEGITPAQVRRDLMTIGYTGSPARGYDVHGLLTRIGELLDPRPDEGIILIGAGRLGRAMLDYLAAQHPEYPVRAAIDNDPELVGRVIHGCRCHADGDLEDIIRDEQVTIGIVAVPADSAQDVADRLVRAGIRGLLNFAPVRLRVPAGVYTQDLDIAVSLEKVAFLARGQAKAQETHE
ncbi:MAG: redox-sensing transcriptional repressor Rex [Phycisphaerae bacterium]|nr:redox-sensing transcriptional repressor Rex [Phycisphaerae bacterium]